VALLNYLHLKPKISHTLLLFASPPFLAPLTAYGQVFPYIDFPPINLYNKLIFVRFSQPAAIIRSLAPCSACAVR
jgi:hypothetical protein